MRVKQLASILLAGTLGVSALVGCGTVDKTATIATMGDVKVSAGVANFFCRYQQAISDDIYKMYFGEDVWSQEFYTEGETLEETTINQAMVTLHELYSLRENMATYNVEFTAEDEAEVAKVVDAFLSANSEDALKEMGADKEYVTELLTLLTIQDKMYDEIVKGADTNVSDEEANMRAYTMVQIDYDQYYDSASYTYVDYTEEERAALKETADKIAAGLNETGDLETVAATYEYEPTTGTYAADDDVLEADLKTAMDALKEGETSGLITTETAYYFVRIDADTDEKATEENRQLIIEERQDEYYTSVLEELQKDDGWAIDESVLKTIKFDDYFTQQTESTESTEGTESVDGTEN